MNGTTFNGVMPTFANLTDHEVADVLSYVRSHFGNHASAVSDAMVAAVRLKLPHAPEGHP